MWLDTFAMAFGALTNNKLRALLTSLGIIIGVASVILMIHLGQAATASVTGSISDLGSSLLIVQPARSRRGSGGRRMEAPPFEMSDVRAIEQGLPGAVVAPAITVGAMVQFGSTSRAIPLTGTTNTFLTVRSWEVESGRAFQDSELAGGAPVCMLGQTVVDDFYGDQLPLGTTLRLGRNTCQVIGILKGKGNSFGNDQDDTILIPWKTAQRRFTGNDEVNVLFVSTAPGADIAQVKEGLTALLSVRREADEVDFDIRDMQEIIDVLSKITGTLTALLGAIAAISLLVGSIGIMNIMLVSVTERTREIGVRLAIGASARDVQMQFLVEASLLSGIGGVLGVLVGLGATVLLTVLLELPFILSPAAVALSVGFSCCIGVIFGFMPARKAAHLNPIEALRHE